LGRGALFNENTRWMHGETYATSYYGSDEFPRVHIGKVKSALEKLLSGLHDVPRAGYVLISLFMAFLIGPLNLIVLRYRRKLALLYITAPLIALLGMGGLLAYTIMDEGLHLKRKSVNVLLHDPASGDGAMYQAHGTFGGLAGRKRPAFPVESLVVPFHSQTLATSGANHLVTDWTSAQKLGSGWIASRRYRGILTVTPTKVRMGMKLVMRDGKVMVENGLTATAKTVAARICEDESCDTASYHIVRNVKPGDTREMLPSETVVAVPLLDMHRMDWSVAAAMEGLPHMDEHDLGGEAFEERMYYVAATHLEAPDLEPRTEEAPDGQ
jgi:hypothetical protein